MLANSSAKFPPVSYAERVKKSTNTKAQGQLHSQRQSVPFQVPSSPTGQTQPPSVTDKTCISTDAVPITPQTSNSGQIPPQVQPAEPADTKIINGDASQEKPSAMPQPSPQKPSVVNVWDLRKEQFAAARASASRLPQSKSLQLNPSSSSPLASALPPSSQSTDAITSSYKHPANGSISYPSSTEDDPFVIRVPARPPPAPTEDEESWPEVGKSVPAVPSSQSAVDKGYDAPTSDNPPSTVTPPRKTEKNKWVPIPPQELQEAADAALKSQRGSHSRNQSQLSNRPPRQTASSASGSVHNPSRPQSGRNSTSQSRTQSRTGSVQSSPRFPRGRRLPNEEMTGLEHQAYNENLLLRNSRVGSPQLSPHSSRQPFLEPNVNIPPYPQGLFPSMPPVNGIHPYFGHPPPPLPQISAPVQGPYPSHSPQNSIHTPFGHSGSESPNYPSQSPQSLPPPHGYPNVPGPYPMYQPHPYEYSQGPSQPYMYWNGSGNNTPPYPPPHLTHYPVPSQLPLAPFPPPPAPNSTVLVPDDSPPAPATMRQTPAESDSIGGADTATTRDQRVVFGSIGIPNANQALSSAPQPNTTDLPSAERGATTFSIGVSPGARIRARSRKGTKVDALTDVTNGDPPARVNETADRKWKFGQLDCEISSDPLDLSSSIPADLSQSQGLPTAPPPPSDTSTNQNVPDFTGPTIPPMRHSPLILTSTLPPLTSPQQMPPSLLPPPFSVPRTADSLSPLEVESSSGSSEWEVQDFGYGFGHASGTGFAVALNREQMDVRERERARDRVFDRERLEVQREVDKDMENLGFREPEYQRPRRGSYNGGAFYDRGSRRGRGFARGARRGGDRFHNQPARFSLTPPQNFQALGPMADPNGYYPPLHPMAYIPPGYDGFQPQSGPQSAPVPAPLTQPTFPLDSMRWFLLGQLEYYISPQNMAQDFYLRQQMDEKGWISIPLIASFNRVKRLTTDVSLVRDVLALSTIAEVRDDWVRMRGWEQFVLPDAPASQVEEGFGSAQDHLETEDEEEEEVEFVLGKEAALWTPERRS